MFKKAAQIVFVVLAASTWPVWGETGPKIRLFNQHFALATDCVLWSRPSALENGVLYNCEPEGANYTASIRIDSMSLCQDFRNIKSKEATVEEKALVNSLGFSQAEWLINYGPDVEPIYARGAWDKEVCLLAISSEKAILNRLTEIWW